VVRDVVLRQLQPVRWSQYCVGAANQQQYLACNKHLTSSNDIQMPGGPSADGCMIVAIFSLQTKL
jgi:hypothetical protein